MKKEVRRVVERWYEAGILDPQTMQKIEEFESERSSTESAPDYMRAVLTVAGGGMVALGIVLLIANNWAALSQSAQASLAVLLLITAQIFAGYVLFRKRESRTMIELSASVLFVSIGASIIIISNIYQMSGSFSGLIQTWGLLGLPVVYLMRSYVSSVIFLLMLPVLSFDLTTSGATSATSSGAHFLLFAFWLPYYWMMYQSKPLAAVTRLHHLLIPLVVLSMMPSLYTYGAGLLAGYALIGLLLALTGLSGYTDKRAGLKNGYIFTGLLTFGFVLWLLSMGYVWRDLNSERLVHIPDLVLSVLMISGIVWFGIRNGKGDERIDRIWLLMPPVVLAFVLHAFWYHNLYSVILSNVVLLILALMLLAEGNRRSSLGYMNLGLLFLSTQILSRFFMEEWPLWVRGIGFVIVGLIFIFANRRLMITKKVSENPKFRFGGDIS